MTILNISSFFQGCSDPLYYEIAGEKPTVSFWEFTFALFRSAEITYPVPEGTSAALIVFVYNLTSLIVLFTGRVT
jgi:hypothetical protein